MSSPDLYTEDGLSRRRLPPYDGVLYRSAMLEPADVARYVPGLIVTEDRFFSATPDPAARFVGNVEFVIYSRSARNISLYSAQPAAPEMLFRGGTSFLVRAVVPLPDSPLPGATRIVLEEVETSGRTFVVIERVVFGPPELAEQLPLHCEVVRSLPSRGVADYLLVRTSTTPVYFPEPLPPLSEEEADHHWRLGYPQEPLDLAKVESKLRRKVFKDREKGREAEAVVLPGLVLAPRDAATVIDSRVRDLEVDLHYIIDSSQLVSQTADPDKLFFAAVVRISSVLRPAEREPEPIAPPRLVLVPEIAPEPEPAAPHEPEPAVQPEPEPVVSEPAPPVFVKLDSALTTTFGRDTVIGLITISRQELEHALGHRFDIVADGMVASLILQLRSGETVAVLGPADPAATTFGLQQHNAADPAATVAHFCELSGIAPDRVTVASAWQSPPPPPPPPPAPSWHIGDYVATVQLPPPDGAAAELARQNPNSYLNYRDPALPPQAPTQPTDIVGGRRIDAAGRLTDEIWVNPDYRPQPATAGLRFDTEFELVLWRTTHGYNTIGQFIGALAGASLVAAGTRADPMPLDAPAQADGRWTVPVFTSPQFATEGTDVRRVLTGAQLLHAVGRRPGALVRFNPGTAQAIDLTGENLAAWWAEYRQAGGPEPTPPPPAPPDPAPPVKAPPAQEEQRATQLIRRQPPEAAPPPTAPDAGDTQVSTSALMNTLCYTLQFASELSDPAILARTADGMINHVGYRDPVEDFYRALTETTRRGALDQTALEMARVHSEAELLAFFAALIRTLDERRPWPAPLFVKLEADPWPTSGWTQPIARLRIPRYRLEGRVNHIFDAVPPGQPSVLILRMRSGEVVALVGAPTTDPSQPETTEYALLQRYPGNPAEVIAHFCAYSGIDPTTVVPMRG